MQPLLLLLLLRLLLLLLALVLLFWQQVQNPLTATICETWQSSDVVQHS